MEDTIAKLLLYSFNDIKGYDELTPREKAIVGSEDNFQGIVDWIKRTQMGAEPKVVRQAQSKHSLEAYREGASDLARGTDIPVEEDAWVNRCTNGAYVASKIWVQDNWIHPDGSLTEEGEKFVLRRTL